MGRGSPERLQQAQQAREEQKERRRAELRARIESELARYREENPEGARIDEEICAEAERRLRESGALTQEERAFGTHLPMSIRLMAPGSPEEARLYCEQSVTTHWRQLRQRHMAEDASAVLNPVRGPERLVGSAADLEPLWRASAAPPFHMAVPPVSCTRFDWASFGRSCAEGLAELVGESVGAGTLCGMTPRRARPIIYALRNSTATVGRSLAEANDSMRIFDQAQTRIITRLQEDETAMLRCNSVVQRIEAVERILNLRR
ncbi:hypothetical protein ACFQX4_11765 [Roseomonas sp. GCM10028921]